MNAFANESVGCATGVVETLSESLYSPAGGARATRAKIENVSPLADDSGVVYRFANDPTIGPIVGHRLAPGDFVELKSFEDIQNFKVLLEGADSPAQLYVTYSH